MLALPPHHNEDFRQTLEEFDGGEFAKQIRISSFGVGACFFVPNVYNIAELNCSFLFEYRPACNAFGSPDTLKRVMRAGVADAGKESKQTAKGGK